MNVGIATRLRAGAIHLSISVMMALLAAAVIFFVWYPGELAEAQGVSFPVLIMIGVDVVIGPLITTIIYKPGKWGLRFDLAVIATMQVLALLYGLHTILVGRPAYVVFNVDRFDVVAAQDVSQTSLASAQKSYAVSLLGPKWYAAKVPDDPKKRSDLLFSALGGGADLPQLPEYFVSLDAERSAMLEHLHPMSGLRKLNPADDETWSRLIAELGVPESEMGYLPLRANAKDGAVILDAKTGEVLGIRMLTPRFDAEEKAPKPMTRSGVPPAA